MRKTMISALALTAIVALTSCNGDQLATLTSGVANNSNDITLVGGASETNALNISTNANDLTALAKQLEALNFVIANDSATTSQTLVALNDAVASLATADESNKVVLQAAIDAVLAKLAKGFAAQGVENSILQAQITAVADNSNKLLADQQAEFDAYTAKMSVAFGIVAADKKARLQTTLNRQMTVDFIGGDRMEANKDDIARDQANILRRIASIKKRIASAKADIGKKIVADGGWIFQGPKSQAKKDARIAKDIARNEAVLVKYMTANAALKRIAEDKSDIAEIEATKALIAALDI